MNIRLVLFFLGRLLLLLGISMSFPLFWAFYYHGNDILPLVYSMVITVGAGFLLSFLGSDEGELGRKEGFAVVTFGWLLASAFGALPYVFSGVLPTFTDAYFEAMSGFTTTGASVLTYIEGSPLGILFWRDFTHWLGGMGIILLSVAILPALGVGGMQLVAAEVPGPVAEKLRPRIKETAKLLWIVYIVLSAAEVLLLCLGGMNLFESLCHMFGTMATGGFSTRNASIGAYHSAYVDVVIMIFMFIAGANFSLHYYALKGRLKVYKDAEFIFYTVFTAISVLLITVDLWRHHVYTTIGQDLRYASFQAISIMTTTGYATADFGKWPYLSQFFLLLLMFVGGCAGSTGGAIKHIRIMILLKDGVRRLYRLIHPRAVMPIVLNKEVVSEEIVADIHSFFLLYMLMFVIATVYMSSLGLDTITAISSVAATLGNIGPGLARVGPAQNYAFVPVAGKWLLSMCMLLGRLEIYTVLVLLLPASWRKV